MKPLWLAAAMTVVLSLIFLAAQITVSAPDNPQVVSLAAGSMLAVSFAHEDHIEQNCVECHHNFVDDTGQGMCFDCHKTDPEVADLIEEQFHDLCRSCHEDQQRDGEDHGPTRSCLACHVSDDRP